MPDKMTNFDNFDDFMAANEPNKPAKPAEPVILEVNRNEDGTFGENMITNEEYVAPCVHDDSFKGLFPGMAVSADKIKELFSYAEDKYEKIMGLSIFLSVAAIFNPLMTILWAFSHPDVAVRVRRFCFLGAAVIFLLISLLAWNKTFPIAGLVVIAVLKLYPFSESASDSFSAVAFMFLAYLMFRVKKRRDLGDTAGFVKVKAEEHEHEKK
jgi:hypothetical protein